MHRRCSTTGRLWAFRTLSLCTLLHVNNMYNVLGNTESAQVQYRLLIALIKTPQILIQEYNVTRGKHLSWIRDIHHVERNPLYMIADLTGNRLCFAEEKLKRNLTCFGKRDLKRIYADSHVTVSHDRIISLYHRHTYEDYEIVYTTTTTAKVKGKLTTAVSIKLLDFKSSSSVTIHQDFNIHQENIAVDTVNWLVFYEDSSHDKISYVDLILDSKPLLVPRSIQKTSEGSHRINTMAVDVISVVLYLMFPEALYSWRYLNETSTKLEFSFKTHDKPKSHISLSSAGTLFYTLHLSPNETSLNMMKYNHGWKEYYANGLTGSSTVFGTEIVYQDSEKTSANIFCPRFCRLNGTQNCICWCPREVPLLTAAKTLEPLVVLAIDDSGTKIRTTSSEPSKNWDWLTELDFGNESLAYNAKQNRICRSKLDVETGTRGLWCHYKKDKAGGWIYKAALQDKAVNVLYPLNFAANTTAIYWMAEAVDRTQNLWCLCNGSAKNVLVDVIDPKQVAVDTSRQILFWCTTINGSVHLKWQSFDKKSNKPFERQVSDAGDCRGLAVSEFQVKVYLLSENKIFQASYQELEKDGADFWNTFFVFSRTVETIRGFSYGSGYLVWFNPSVLEPAVAILRVHDCNNYHQVRKPSKVIAIKNSTRRVQILVSHQEPQCNEMVPETASPTLYHGDSKTAVTQPTEPQLVKSTSPRPQRRASVAPTIPIPPVMETDAEVHEDPRKIKTEATTELYEGDPAKTWWWPHLAGMLSFVAVAAVLNFWACRRYKQRTTSPQQSLQNFVTGNEVLARECTSEVQRALHLPFKCIIPPNSLQLTESSLGAGNFGIVCWGRFNGRHVAVKTIKNPQDDQLIQDFLKELKIMAYVGLHENIVEFFGADISQDENAIVRIVLELCPYGSLESFVRKFHFVERNPTSELDSGYANLQQCDREIRPLSVTSEDGYIDAENSAKYLEVLAGSQAPSSNVSLDQLAKWAHEIASGMSYLEDKNVVHGDLATRNVLVCEDLRVKISDFGFSKNMYKSETYRKKKTCPLPWRWASPETLSRLEFSFKADVWSYGITVWEIFMLGAVPYSELTWDKEFLNRIKRGLRPPQPQYLPLELHESVLVRCWNLVPGKRPSFQELKKLWVTQLDQC